MAFESEPGVSIDSELVELSIPALPEFISLPRMTIAAVAAHGSFDVEEVEDIRLAIEELCLATFEGRGRGRLHLQIGLGADALEVTCTFESEGPHTTTDPRSDLASQMTAQLLGALADEYGIDLESGSPRAWFRKARPSPPAE
jgi:hypothetical protein